MIKENCIKLLGLGLSHVENSYKNIQIDLKPEERNSGNSSFAFEGEEFKPNSAEEYNLSQRKLYQVRSFAAEDLTLYIRTRNMAYSHALKVLKTAEYLISILELAKDINEMVSSIIKTTRSIKQNNKISKEDRSYQIAKNAVCTYIDILLEIKARITDLENSRCNHFIARTYSNLDTRVQTMLKTYYIPDELSENFNNLYENYPLYKFSMAKAEGISRSAMQVKFEDLAERLYFAAIHPFLSELLEEYSYFITPDTFLNNPHKEALFVVPMSIYKKLNFMRSGLTREEIIFLETKNDMEKTTHNLGIFYDELLTAMTCMYEKVKIEKNKLFNTKDKGESEWVVDAFLKKFCHSTLGNIRCIQTLLKDDFFREKFTVLLYDLRPDLLVDMLTLQQDPWEITRDIREDNALDVETAVYLYHLLMYSFEKNDYSNLRSQMARFLNLFSYNNFPDKSLARYMRKVRDGELTWADSELGRKFKAALEK